MGRGRGGGDARPLTGSPAVNAAPRASLTAAQPRSAGHQLLVWGGAAGRSCRAGRSKQCPRREGVGDGEPRTVAMLVLHVRAQAVRAEKRAFEKLRRHPYTAQRLAITTNLAGQECLIFGVRGARFARRLLAGEAGRRRDGDIDGVADVTDLQHALTQGRAVHLASA